MRKSYNDVGFLIRDDILLGVNLGWDHCAEHEWGIGYIHDCFGLTHKFPLKEFGIKRLQITYCPTAEDGLSWFSQDGWEGIIFTSHLRIPSSLLQSENDLAAGWDETSFMVGSSDREQQDKLRKIYEAIQALDAVIWLGGGGPFANAGLCIGIASVIPEDIRDIWQKADEKRQRVYEHEQEYLEPVKKLLKAAGREWFALSAKDCGDGIKYWLNPCNQDRNNFGYFTLEELRSWAKGEGPIPKR